MRTTKVWRQVSEGERVCDLGHKHEYTVWVSKTLTQTGRTKPYDHGYGGTPDTSYELMDKQGRVYWSIPALDYSGCTGYAREDAVYFYGRPSTWKDAIDVLGRRIK